MQKVVLVDDDENLLGAFAEFLELAAGVKCLAFRGFNELAARKSDVCNGEVSLAILDINLGAGEPSGIDIYRWLREEKFAGKIVFLTGHAEDHPLVRDATTIGDASVFTKPVDIPKLLSLVNQQSHESPKIG